MEAKQKICKICNKRYSSGKALGGHMRSHLVKLPLPPKPNQNQPGSGSGSGSASVSVSVSTSPSSSSSLVNLQKAELSPEYSSESQSDQSRHGHVTRRRSKRRRRSLAAAAAVAVAVPETFSAEDAAWFLIKLSRDKWEKVGSSEEKREVVEKELNAKFKCETCNKVFGSYQALGGHKANHKKMMKNEISEDDEDEDEEDYESIEEEEEVEGNNEGRNNNYVNIVVDDDHLRRRSFQCQFCFKVFGSGQALGGHKKVHFSNNLPVTARISSRKFDDSLIIDLNLPAVADEEEGF